MSAFLVSHEHIDVLVQACLEGPSEPNPQGLDWDAMDCMLSRLQERRGGLPNRLGRMLWTENLRSVQARYPDTDLREFCSLEDPEREIRRYTYFRPGPHRPAVEILKAIDSYEYQSCEHAGWKESATRSLCDWLRRSLISYLPGYHEAPWVL